MQLRWKVLRSAVRFAIVTVLTFMVLPHLLAQQPKTQTLTGVVSDTTCSSTHNMKNMTPAECTRACAKQGGYALVVANTVYRLKGHEADLEKLAGEAATVKGAVNGKTVTVESVAPRKSA